MWNLFYRVVVVVAVVYFFRSALHSSLLYSFIVGGDVRIIIVLEPRCTFVIYEMGIQV